MTDSKPERRNTNSDRRKPGKSTPPPGTVIDRRLGFDPRSRVDPRTNGETEIESTGDAGTRKARKKSLVPTGSGEGHTNSTDSTPATNLDSNPARTGLERKRGRGRRLSEFTKSAEEGEMTTEQFLFLMAIDAFKKGNDRMFPTWTDVLEVIRLLGYRKTMPTELNLPSAEDWLERSDTPANVRPDRWAERFTEGSPAAESKKATAKSEEELTDEALDAFEEAFGEDDDFGDDFDSDSDSNFDDGLDDDLSEAA